MVFDVRNSWNWKKCEHKRYPRVAWDRFVVFNGLYATSSTEFPGLSYITVQWWIFSRRFTHNKSAPSQLAIVLPWHRKFEYYNFADCKLRSLSGSFISFNWVILIIIRKWLQLVTSRATSQLYSNPITDSDRKLSLPISYIYKIISSMAKKNSDCAIILKLHMNWIWCTAHRWLSTWLLFGEWINQINETIELDAIIWCWECGCFRCGGGDIVNFTERRICRFVFDHVSVLEIQPTK